MSECKSAGGATRLPSIQPPDESMTDESNGRDVSFVLYSTGCINPASHPRQIGERASEEVSAHGEENVGTFNSSKLHRREFKAEQGLILSQPAAARTMCLSEGVRARLRARVECTQTHTLAHTSNPSASTHMHSRPLLHQAFPICVLAEAACVLVCLCF